MANVALITLFVALSGQGIQGAQVTPMQKVLQMMDEMRTKGEEEKNAEAVTFATFATWCTNTANQRGKAIKKGASAMERLSAEIMKLDADTAELGQDLQGLDTLIDQTTIEKDKAHGMRNVDHKDYEVVDEDLGTSIGDAKAAKKELKRMMSSGGAASFVQISSDTEEDSDEPEAAQFESQSGQITEVVTGLENEFGQEQEGGWKEEAEAAHAWTMLEQTLTDEIEKSNRIRNKKASTKKEKEAASAEATGELAETSKTHEDDVAYLSDLKATCEQKTKDFETRQQLRGDELEAIDKAIEILKGVADSAEKHLPALAQFGSDASSALAQLRRSGVKDSQVQAAAYLEAQGRKFNSRTLALISLRVSEDPFRKVTKMIKDMIFKLQEEAADETEHKGFCDTELGTNKMSRDSLSGEVEELTASIEAMDAKTVKLANEVSQLSADVADLDATVSKATELRAAEKEKNTATIADAKEAVGAVGQAITVLKEFYAKAAGSTAFMQGVSDDMPETFEKPYTGMAGGGVMGMLEVCLSDFQRLEADTTQAEQSADDEFTRFNNDSQIDKAEKSTSIKMKEELKTKTESNRQTGKGDLQSTQAQLDAALEYFEKLKPSCVNTEISYEDRVAARKEEIQSLKEALQILA